jgi:hypothetical protein
MNKDANLPKLKEIDGKRRAGQRDWVTGRQWQQDTDLRRRLTRAKYRKTKAAHPANWILA